MTTMLDTGQFPTTRLRRLRKDSKIRSLVQDVYLNIDKLVLPLFVIHGKGIKNPISSMPGHYQLSLDLLEEEIITISNFGINNVILFGIPESKDAYGSNDEIIQSAVKTIKKINPNLLVIADTCLCEYTDHGHCGVVHKNETNNSFCVDNDESLKLLAKQAVNFAKAGADIIAPSANMDGMVQAIRTALDEADYKDLPILSYAVKYSSAMYGPFRQAANGAPQFGDRSSYQMNYTNAYEALRECALDINEGADMLMVKPAHTYLDIIHSVKQQYPYMPLAAYHTSGEFACLKAAAQNGWIDEQKSVTEVLTAIHRAGANFIITYYAKEVAQWLKSRN